MEQNFLPRIHPKILQNNKLNNNKIIKIKSKEKLKSYYYKKLNENSSSPSFSSSNSSSISIYKDGYNYMTNYEKEIMELNINKRKFLAGNFNNYSGIASSMPCRKEGLIRTSSEYISPLQPHHKDKNIPLYGVWQPT